MIRSILSRPRGRALAALLVLAALALGVFAPRSGRVAEAHGTCDAYDYESFRPTGYYCAYATVGNQEFSSWDGAKQTQDVTMYVDEQLELGGRSMAIVDGGGAPKPLVDWGDGATENAQYGVAQQGLPGENYNHWLWSGKQRFQHPGTYTVKMTWWFLCCVRYDATFTVRVLDRSTPAAAAPYDVVVCEHGNFNGGCKGYVQSGGKGYGDLIQDGFTDAASSIWVRAGAKVALYSDGQAEGTCETFTASDSWLGDNLIGNDRASSLWLNHECSQDVQLCEHINLQGRCVTFRKDRSHLGSTDIGNDAASSIRVPNGVLVSVYSNSDYHGLIDTYSQQKTRNFGSGCCVGNDSASSIRVDLRGNYPLSGSVAGKDVLLGLLTAQ